MARDREGRGRGQGRVVSYSTDVRCSPYYAPPSFQQGATIWPWLNETASSPWPGQTVLPTTWSLSAISTEPTRLPIRAGLPISEIGQS